MPKFEVEVLDDNGEVVTTSSSTGEEVEFQVAMPGLPGDLGPAIDLGTVAGAIDLKAFFLGTQTFRLTTGNANLTLAVADMPKVPTGTSGSFSLRILQGATPRTLTLAAAIKESFANPPALTATAGAIDLLTFMWTGAEWVCFLTASALG